jgi:hypothetical protein
MKVSCSFIALALCSCAAAGSPKPQTAPSATSAAGPFESLTFETLLELRGNALQPSARLLAARGKRVRLVGFMAEMDLPPPNAFYLTRRPVACDEAGGGTADLPPDAVRVEVTSLSAVDLPFIPGAIQVIGTLDVGPKEHADGRLSTIRILLGADATAAARSKPRATHQQAIQGG